MQIHGLNKLTLLDYPGHLACTVFTGACNFRCPFCHNASLVLTPDCCGTLSTTEVFDFLRSRRGRLEGVCITGGEPTLQQDLPEFIADIRSLGFLVKLDTNGYRPDLLKQLLNDRLVDMVAMDIKNAKAVYAQTCGLLPGQFRLSAIEESISTLLSSGIPHEFRTTVTAELHTKEYMLQLADWLQTLSLTGTGSTVFSSPYYLQNFKDSGDLVCGTSEQFHPHDLKTLQEYVTLLKPILPTIMLRGE